MFNENPNDPHDDEMIAAHKKGAKPVADDKLDSTAMLNLHTQLLGFFRRELDKQAPWRTQMEIDEDFFDHDQWPADVKAELEARGQVPLVYNVSHIAISWILGSERRSPMSYRILPRRKDGMKHAERKTELMNYLADVNDTPMHISRAFKEQVIAGLSWMETGAQDPDDGEVVYERYESWRNILADSNATELDFSDARYIFRTKWLDMDRATAMFHKRKGTIQGSVASILQSDGISGEGGDHAMDSHEADSIYGYSHHNSVAHSQRPRVRIYECWYQTPTETETIRGGDFAGEIYDEYSEGHRQEVETGRAQIVTRVRERMHVAIFTDNGLLFHAPSPYRHNRFPFTAIWGQRRARDGAPYGAMRGIRDIQLDVNKRAAKSLFHMSASTVTVEADAVEDLDVLRDEAHRPDRFIVYKAGKAAPTITTDLHIANAHGNAMMQGIDLIQQTSGVTGENMGHQTNATSGKAILAKQDEGRLTTSAYFENLRYGRKMHGQKVLSNIEQFFDEEKSFRITNKRGNPEYININDENPKDDNKITHTKADFVVSEEDYSATHRQANLEMLTTMIMPLAQNNPALMMSILDLLVEAMDIPKQEEIVKRIRQITGQSDPDSDPNDPDEEELAARASKEAQGKMEARAAEAEISNLEGKAAETQAKASKLMAESAAMAGKSEGQQISNLKAAIEAAVQLLGNQGAGDIADMLMETVIREAAAQDQASGNQMPMADMAPEQDPMQAPMQGEQPQDPMMQPEAAPLPV